MRARAKQSKRPLRFSRGGRPTLSESAILKAVREYLEWEQLAPLRVHCGRARVGGEKRTYCDAFDPKKPVKFEYYQKERWLQLAEAGTPDLQFRLPAGREARNPDTDEVEMCEYARIVYVETKREDGGRLSGDQTRFIARAKKDGALAYVVDSVEELMRLVPPGRRVL